MEIFLLKRPKGGNLSRFLKMGQLFLGHSLIIIKKIERFFLKICNLTPCALQLVETFWLVEKFFKTIHGTFRNNKTINLLIRCR